MQYIIAYDISDNKKRNKVARILEKTGVRLQKSVFAVKCENYKLRRLLFQLEKFITSDDSIIVFKLCKGCEAKSIYIGKPVRKYYIF